MRRLWWPLAGAMALAAAAAQDRRPEPDGVYLFFDARSPGLARIAGDLAGRPFRPVFLPSTLKGELPPEFLDAVAKFGREFPVIDGEGLDLARRFEVRRLPCLVVVARGRRHVAAGAGVDVKEVLGCSR